MCCDLIFTRWIPPRISIRSILTGTREECFPCPKEEEEEAVGPPSPPPPLRSPRRRRRPPGPGSRGAGRGRGTTRRSDLIDFRKVLCSWLFDFLIWPKRRSFFFVRFLFAQLRSMVPLTDDRPSREAFVSSQKSRLHNRGRSHGQCAGRG